MTALRAALEVNVGYRGIAADEGTALLIEREARAEWGNHNAKGVGQSFVYFVERDETAPDSPANGMLVTKAHIRKVRAGLTFDYCAGQANAGEVYDVDCHDMDIWSSQPAPGGPRGNVY